MIFAKPNGDLIEIRFAAKNKEQFADYVERIKKIYGRKYVPSNNDHYWTIPISQQSYLKSLFERSEIEWQQEEVKVAPKNISDNPMFLDELKLTPYPFQAIGMNFLCDTKNCIIADQMGLGKTVQTIGAAYKLYRKGQIKKVLIICPSALKYQWGEEIDKFIDTEKYNISYTIIDGTKKQRVVDYDYLHENKVLYTIINYELVLNDIDYLLEFEWDVIALDEVHRIRNWKSKTSQAINKLNAEYKWGATGTPVQNKPEELFNIFGFINSKVLGNWWQFRNSHIIIGEKFGQQNMVLGYKKLGWLHEKISPYMLRRLKKDVAPDLPEMIISNYYVEMYPEQYKLHESIREDLFNTIKEISQFTERDENGNIIKQHPKADSILGMFAMLQGTCDTPYLLEMSDSKMAERYKIGDGKFKSPKIDELEDILKDFIDSYEPENTPEKYNGLGPKAVIFTQFDRMRMLIVERISKLGKCEIINGKLNSKKKIEALRRFQIDPNIRFLVCTDAANYGLNISQANLLISIDLPWNPAVWQQRNARIHRIDSEYKNINIINLISKDGLDERILDVLYNKQDMAAAIIESRDEEKEQISNLTSNMMSKLLKAKKKKEA